MMRKIENKTTLESLIEILFEVALVEEFCKWLVLKKITWNNKKNPIVILSKIKL